MPVSKGLTAHARRAGSDESVCILSRFSLISRFRSCLIFRSTARHISLGLHDYQLVSCSVEQIRTQSLGVPDPHSLA